MAAPLTAAKGTNAYGALLGDAVTAYGIEVARFSPRELALGDYDLVHVHWPDWFARGRTAWTRLRWFVRGLVFFGLILARRKPVVWTVHNLRPHGSYSATYLRIVEALLARTTRLMLVMTEASVAELARADHSCAAKPYRLVRHGTYPRVTDVEPPPRTDLLYFGGLYRYKGVETLIDCVQAADRPLRLEMVGAASDRAYAAELAAAVSHSDRIALRTGWVSDEELERAILTTRLVVLPYRQVLNSGPMIHALSLGRPVLVPDTPTFRELAAVIGSDWVHCYDRLTPGSIYRALDHDRSAPPELSQFSWEVIGRQVSDAYRAVTGGKSIEPAGRSGSGG